ncbi:hypothetical protein C8R44DRAFT_752732 [Mycena epipterygia]|nr:hypothetical protein C8R44DRAFT_752732 [Mycena epipterygia]
MRYLAQSSRTEFTNLVSQLGHLSLVIDPPSLERNLSAVERHVAYDRIFGINCRSTPHTAYAPALSEIQSSEPSAWSALLTARAKAIILLYFEKGFRGTKPVTVPRSRILERRHTSRKQSYQYYPEDVGAEPVDDGMLQEQCIALAKRAAVERSFRLGEFLDACAWFPSV